MPLWNKVKLVDVCEKIGSGATPRGGDANYISHGISLVRSQNVLDFVFSKDGLAHITEQQANELSNVELKERDVLVNITGDSVARVCQIPNQFLPARVNQHVAILRADRSKLNPEYLKYCLLQPSNKERLLTYASIGATRKALTKGMLEGFEIQIPELPVQTRIASILSDLDKKINLNRQISKTLEQIAEAIFKKYFVTDIDLDKMPKDWRLGKFKDYVEVERGLSYKGSGLCTKDEGIPMHNLNSIYEGGGYKNEGIKYYKGEYRERHQIKSWDIIISNTEQGHKHLLIGCPAIVPNYFGDIGIFTQHIYKLKLICDDVTIQYFYYLILQSSIREQIIACTNGTTVNMLSIDGLQKPVFVIPPTELLKNFSKTISSIWLKQEENYLETEILKNLRDTLLPKLMSGKVNLEQIATIA